MLGTLLRAVGLIGPAVTAAQQAPQQSRQQTRRPANAMPRAVRDMSYEQMRAHGIEEQIVLEDNRGDGFHLHELQALSREQAADNAARVARQFRDPRGTGCEAFVNANGGSSGAARTLFRLYGERLGWESEADAADFYRRTPGRLR